MIQSIAAATAADEPVVSRKAARIWGLGAAELHDAYWRALGVQCIRRGQMQPLQPGADLFLLIEPDQLVLFDLRAIAERLAWRAARVTRVRVVGQDDEDYAEQVVVNDAGIVERIARRYRRQTHATYRVLLTRNRRLAKVWMTTESRRTGWRKIRKIAGQANVDAWRSPGVCLSLENEADHTRLIDQLVISWANPDRVLHGITAIAEQVWSVTDKSVDDDEIIIGPVWLGHGCAKHRNLCLVGPMWLPDDTVESAAPVRVRDILEIEPGEARSPDSAAQPKRTAYAVAKRTLDMLVSGIGLFLLLPLMAFIAFCIWREDGRPVLYRQSRQSRGGREFGCWKFRTMCRDADAMKAQLAESNVCDGPQFYLQDDPRVTKIGRVLRRLYLDELPQLWNVLIGDMSLVGPRPSPESENQICPAWRDLRLSVRPGLTGLWQLERTRLPGTDFQEWIKYDLEYLERASFWFDLQLLARTAITLIKP